MERERAGNLTAEIEFIVYFNLQKIWLICFLLRELFQILQVSTSLKNKEQPYEQLTGLVSLSNLQQVFVSARLNYPSNQWHKSFIQLREPRSLKQLDRENAEYRQTLSASKSRFIS